jgi:hypothetical protein
MRIEAGQVRPSATDVANFLACRHLTRLELLRARGVISPPRAYEAGFADLVARGDAHEKEVLQGFRDRGLQVVDLSPHKGNVAAGADATAAALSSGADVIYQGVLTRAPAGGQPALLGHPDFLVRADLIEAPDGEPRPDGARYEVVDAKLARSAKGRAVADARPDTRHIRSPGDPAGCRADHRAAGRHLHRLLQVRQRPGRHSASVGLDRAGAAHRRAHRGG